MRRQAARRARGGFRHSLESAAFLHTQNGVCPEAGFDEVRKRLAALVGQVRPAAEAAPVAPVVKERMLLCGEPEELYRVPARALIGTVLDGWLTRQMATPFELLHNPDLVDKLERSGVEMQHAVQKVAVPAALARRVKVHKIVRQLHGLIESAIARLRADQQNGRLPAFTPETFAEACAALMTEGDGGYRLGAGVAAVTGKAGTWNAKIDLLLDLADAAPAKDPARAFALGVLEQPLREILRSRPARAELLGPGLDFGTSIFGLAALAHGPAVEAVVQVQPAFAALRPAPSPAAARLARRLAEGGFPGARQDVSNQILQDFGSRRRLRVEDGVAEIEAFRALAVCLTAASGAFMPADDVRAAVVERSRLMVEQHLLDALLTGAASPAAELMILASVLENVAGDANRRRALQVLEGALATRRLEDAATAAPEAALAELSRLYRRTLRAGAGVAGVDAFLEAIGRVGGRIEAAHRVVKSIAEGVGPRDRRIALLERMACAETAPPGLAAERAAAALKAFA